MNEVASLSYCSLTAFYSVQTSEGERTHYNTFCLFRILTGVRPGEAIGCLSSFTPSAILTVNVLFAMMELGAAASVIAHLVITSSSIACKVWAAQKYVKML